MFGHSKNHIGENCIVVQLPTRDKAWKKKTHFILKGNHEMSQNNAGELKAIARRYVDVWNQHNAAALDTVFAAHAVRHDPAVGVSTGIESIREVMQTLLTAFPDIALTIDQELADEDCAILRWTGTGTHGGDFQGIPATDKRFTITGHSVYQCAKDKMVVERTIWDALGLLKQLGVVPE